VSGNATVSIVVPVCSRIQAKYRIDRLDVVGDGGLTMRTP
jgi:hypothetical protein